MLAGLAKGLVLRAAAYALFLGGFWLLYQAFQRDSILLGIIGGGGILIGMWAMTGFRRRPAARSETSGNARGDAPDKGG